LKAGACVRRARLVMVAPDLRHPRRSQAEIPLIDLSEFGQPPLSSTFRIFGDGAPLLDNPEDVL
jgi:hypothetical protein